MSGTQNSIQFLTLAESAAIDATSMSTHEKFLTRLTLSSLRLLVHIAADYGVAVEELTAEQTIAWFEKDAQLRREHGPEAAFLQW